MLSHTAEYALRAVLYLAGRGDPDRLVQVGEMALALRIPRNYLSKVLHQLAREGVLFSTRGKLGGFRLAEPSNRLRLARIVAPFGRLGERRQCLLGRPQCTDRTACAAHSRWKGVSENVAAFFQETTIADLLLGAATAS